MTIFLPLQISGTILVLALIAYLVALLYQLLYTRIVPHKLQLTLQGSLMVAVMLNLGSLLWLLWAWL